MCASACLSVANVARSQQLLSNKLSAVRVKRQQAAVKTMRRCLAESPKSQSRNLQLATGKMRTRFEARPGQTGYHLTKARFVYPANASRVVCRGLRGKARPEWRKSARGLSGLMIRPGPVRAGVGLTSDLFLGTKYYNDQRCEPDKPETVGHTVEESSKM